MARGKGEKNKAHALEVWVSGNADDACSAQLRKLVVLKLLRNGPGYEVTVGTLALGEPAAHGRPAQVAFQTQLNPNR
jgi:hypothetical protein